MIHFILALVKKLLKLINKLIKWYFEVFATYISSLCGIPVGSNTALKTPDSKHNSFINPESFTDS